MHALVLKVGASHPRITGQLGACKVNTQGPLKGDQRMHLYTVAQGTHQQSVNFTLL